jgi:excisionase family DNA binding protein
MTLSTRRATSRAHREPEWLSIQQAAETYGVSHDTIRRRIAAGQLPASRCGGRIIRVRIADLDGLFRPLTTSAPVTPPDQE